MPESSFVPDPSQQKIINIQFGQHLVLAPPGCGKTQILAERIRNAHDSGVGYDDMLCLTFTNRAARGMKERIGQNVDKEDAAKVFVGNVHRYCSKFLFDNGIVTGDTSIIDEDDAISILANFLGQEEQDVKSNYSMRRHYSDAFHFCTSMWQIRHYHPKDMRVHPDCITKEDVMALGALSKMHKKTLDNNFMVDVYDNVDFYRDSLSSPDCSYATHLMVEKILVKMRTAHSYQDYKDQNHLVDFADLLIMTYEALRSDREEKYKRFPWIQVDEVQDLNYLQLAIIDLLTTKGVDGNVSATATVMYLGDEQQAIFSFMGAKLSSFDRLRARCKGNIHHLDYYHRSPKYLLDIYNTYAEKVLHIAPDILPKPSYDAEKEPNSLRIVSSVGEQQEYDDCVSLCRYLVNEKGRQRTAVLVSSNADADIISGRLLENGLSHFKISGVDLFATDEMKTLFAHLSVLANAMDFISWARLVKGLQVFKTNAASRGFVQTLFANAVLPTDVLRGDDDTYVQRFVRCYEEREIVIFDTETTGLDVVNDDIVQIAAVKVRRGVVVKGSEFNVFISTKRHIPEFLGDIPNPVIKEMQTNDVLEPSHALHLFLDYVGDDIILGHNVEYDYNILDYNMRRYMPSENLHSLHPEYFDSLLLARLLEPDMVSYKLKNLLVQLHLEGNNAHLADEDVNATRNLVVHCYQKATLVIGNQCQLLKRPRVRQYAEAFRRVYSDFYASARRQLYAVADGMEPVTVMELRRFHDFMVDANLMEPVEKLSYVLGHISYNIISGEGQNMLAAQLAAHMVEMNTLKEADLCDSDLIDERIFVTTVHKAKGLEFENVIVFDCIDGRYPNFYNRDNEPLIAEDARKLYVALSRSKKRIYVLWSAVRQNYSGRVYDNHLSPFLVPVLKYFEEGDMSSLR